MTPDTDTGRRPGPLDRIRANPTGRFALKVGVTSVGVLLIALGLVLVPLPGPGWLVVLSGLAVLAVEYAWARQVLHFGRRRLHRWTRWTLRRPLPVPIAVAAAGMAVVAGAVWASVRLSFGIDLAGLAWHRLT